MLSVVGSAGPRASTAATRRRSGSRSSTVTARRTRPKVSTAPAHITSAAPSASQAPVSGSCPAAAGGGSMICDATITATATTAAGRYRRSTTSTSCEASPSPPAIAPSASTNSTRSQTSNPSHAVISPVNQLRNRLTSRSRAPSITSSGPASSLRVIDPPQSDGGNTSQQVRAHAAEPPATQEEGRRGVGRRPLSRGLLLRDGDLHLRRGLGAPCVGHRDLRGVDPGLRVLVGRCPAGTTLPVAEVVRVGQRVPIRV